jgi:hypothetical protein
MAPDFYLLFSIAGYFVSNGLCTECEKGYFCPGGENQTKCPDCTDTISVGSSSIDQCLCDIGCGKESEDKECTLCSPRYFKTNLDSSPCLACPSDSYSNSTILGDVCSLCDPGYSQEGGVCKVTNILLF